MVRLVRPLNGHIDVLGLLRPQRRQPGTERLDVEKDGGFLRIGLVHYNTPEEVNRLLQALNEIAKKLEV